MAFFRKMSEVHLDNEVKEIRGESRVRGRLAEGYWKWERNEEKTGYFRGKGFTLTRLEGIERKNTNPASHHNLWEGLFHLDSI